MDQLQSFVADRRQDLDYLGLVMRKFLYTGMLPAREEFTQSMIGTLIALLLLPNLLRVLVQKKARKILLDTLESILAVCLIIILLGIVLGLPVGAVYLMGKGAVYFVHSLLKLPAVAGMLQSALNRSAASMEQQ